MDINVGQSVVVEHIGSAARYKTGDDVYLAATVKSIGRKWFVVSIDEKSMMYFETQYRFDIETGYADGKGYSPNYRVWLSMDAIKLESERIQLLKDIRCAFTTNGGNVQNLTIGELRDIHKMVCE